MATCRLLHACVEHSAARVAPGTHVFGIMVLGATGLLGNHTWTTSHSKLITGSAYNILYGPSVCS